MADTTRPSVEETNAKLLRALTSLREMRARLEVAEGARSEPIAIIGMGCRFPGAPSPEAYWELLRDGVDAITETPVERWDAPGLFDPDPDASGHVATRWGGFLDDIDRFDAAFFGISPREAAQMDPQQRLLLEVAWEALEDGGQRADDLGGSRTGVFVGVHSHSSDYYMMQADGPGRLDSYSGTGTSHSVVSGRLSYLLDLRGPSVALDTACSSSLVAIHLAVQSLRSGECTMALAGGVNAILDPSFTMVASRMRMMSPTGRCKPFDVSADGFVRAEGCGVIVLKRLSDAVAAGDRVLAVIRGSAVNQDGHSNGLTAPNSLSQQSVIRDALANAGVTADRIGMIEAHGTGTPLGDPIEVEALSAVFGGDGVAPGTCALGSAKANIGHLEGAAGVAGVIKAVLSIRHHEVPRLVHFHELIPHVSLADTPFVVPTENRPWPAEEGSRHAGVSSFGWSGTNAHIVVGEAPVEPAAVVPADPAANTDLPLVLPISARSGPALVDLAGAYRRLLVADPSAAADELCATAGRHRSHHAHRLAAVGRDRGDLVGRLDAFLAGDEQRGLATGKLGARGRELVVFVFPGQGSQWHGMAQRLMAEAPAFREAVVACDAAFAPYVDWSLVEQLDAQGRRLDDIDVIQPALFAIQVGLVAMWRAWGVEPDAVIGHSMGEVAAAHAAGILSLDDAARVICRRSSLLRRISGEGAMAVVELSMQDAAAAIVGHESELSIAVSNSATSTVLSGEPVALQAVMDDLTARDVFCRLVKVDVASHSPQVDPLRTDLLGTLRAITPRDGAVPLLSTVTGEFEDGAAMDADYWVRNLRQPVLFGAGVERLLRDGHRTFIEISPHPVLLAAIDETMQRTERPGCTISSLQRDSDEPVALTSALGALYASGHPVDWALVQPGRVRPIDLPMYPWQRERHWLEPGPVRRSQNGARIDPLLGWPVPVGDGDDTHVWENLIEHGELETSDELDGSGSASMPVGTLVDVALRAVHAAGRAPSLSDVTFGAPLAVSTDQQTRTQVVVGRDAASRPTVTVFSEVDGAWTRHLTAAVGVRVGRAPDRSGSDTSASVEVSVDDLSARPTGAPSMLDVCLAAAQVAAMGDDARAALTARSIGEVRIIAVGSTPALCRVSTAETGTAGSRLATVQLLDADGTTIAEIDDLVLSPVGAPVDRPDEWCYRIDWRPSPVIAGETTEAGEWMIVADDGPGAQALARELTAFGHRSTLVGFDVAADLVLRRLADGGTVDARIVILADVDGPSTVDSDLLADVERAVVRIGGAVVSIATALSDHDVRVPIHIVTRGAHTVAAQTAEPVVSVAPLWGLGRSLAEELPDVFGWLIDVDPDGGIDDVMRALAAFLATVPRSGDGERETALRGTERYVARLVRQSVPGRTSLELRPDATYIVTGGFGGLGSQVARWMVGQGARRLILVGRTALPPRREWAALDPLSVLGRRAALVLDLEAMGATIHIAPIDVGDVDQLAAYIDDFRAEGWPAIRGVIHTAAISETTLIPQLRATAMWEQMRAKVVGAAALDALFQDLDIFVMFSSIASILPEPGQGAYAAGNTFLDALAHRRAGRGRPATTISWGYWEGAGEALLGPEWRRQLGQMVDQGFSGFRIEQGLDGLGRLVESGAPHAVFVPIDWATYASARAARPFVEDMIAEAMAATAASGGATSHRSTPERLAEAAVDDRTDIVEHAVRQIAGRVLKLAEAQIDPAQPLGGLGLDSLMAIDLRNRLEAEFRVKLSATLAWNYPTVEDLAGHMLSKLGLEPTSAAAAMPSSTPAFDATVGSGTPPEPSSLQGLIDATDDLDDDDIINALMRGRS